MFLLNNLFLASPLEGFKSQAYYTEIGRLNDFFTLTNWTSDLNNQVSFSTLTSLVLFGINLSILFVYKNTVNSFVLDPTLVLKVFFFSTLLFVFNFWNSINSYYINIFNSNTGIVNVLETNIQSILFFTIKDVWSFLTILLTVYLFSSKAYTNLNLIPSKLIDIFSEYMYKASLTLFTSTLDIKHMHEVRDYQEFFLKVHAILLFVLGSNLSGMIPYSTTITSSLMNTLFLSLAVFINIVLTIIKEKGVNYFFGLFMPAGCPIGLILLLIPIEVISYSFRLVSLSVRLFANMMAGHTLLKVIVGFSWSLILLGDLMILVHYVPFFVLFILMFLEIGVAFIQTYVFVVLTYMYLRDFFAAH